MRCPDDARRSARAGFWRRLLGRLCGACGAVQAPDSKSEPDRQVFDAVVFLDFDGVLHPRTQGTFRAVPLLQAWLQARPEVHVVVSSNWRMSHSLGALRELFEAPLSQRIVDALPFAGPERHGERQRLIEAWLASRSVRAWAALDDDASLFEPHCPWLVRTRTEEALTQRELEQLDVCLAGIHGTR